MAASECKPGWPPGAAVAAFTGFHAAIAAVALGIMSRHLPSLLEMDALGYYKSAINLMRHGVFSEASAPGLHPISFRTPGYPALLSALFRVTGPGVVPAAVLNLVLLWVTGLATMATAHRLGCGTRRVLLAGLLVSASPLALFWATQVYTDTLFVAVFALAMMLGVPALSGSACPRRLVACAAVAGLLPLVRPVGLYVAAAGLGMGILLLLGHWRAIAGTRPGRAIVVAALCLMAALGPTAAWMARNRAQFGTFHFCEIGAWNLRFAHMNVVISRTEGADFGVLFADSFKETYPRIYRPTTSPGLLAREWTGEALEIARRHPGMTVRVAMENVVPLFSPSIPDWRRGLGLEGEPGAGARLLSALEWLLVVGASGVALWNAILCWRAGELRAVVFVLAGLSLVLVAVSLPAGNMTAPRFRLPLWPVLVLMAVAGPRGRGPNRRDQAEAAASCSAT